MEKCVDCVTGKFPQVVYLTLKKAGRDKPWNLISEQVDSFSLWRDLRTIVWDIIHSEASDKFSSSFPANFPQSFLQQ